MQTRTLATGICFTLLFASAANAMPPGFSVDGNDVMWQVVQVYNPTITFRGDYRIIDSCKESGDRSKNLLCTANDRMENGIPASKPDGGYDIAAHIRSNTTRGNFASGTYSLKNATNWGTSQGSKSGIVYVVCAAYYPGKQIDTDNIPETGGAPTIDAVGTLEKHQNKINKKTQPSPLKYARASQEVLYIEGVEEKFIKGAYVIDEKDSDENFSKGNFIANQHYNAICR